jgi:hypothetical protein
MAEGSRRGNHRNRMKMRVGTVLVCCCLLIPGFVSAQNNARDALAAPPPWSSPLSPVSSGRELFWESTHEAAWLLGEKRMSNKEFQQF